MSVFVYAYRVKMHSTINRSGVSVIIVCVRLCVRVLVRLGSVCRVLKKLTYFERKEDVVP